MSSYYATNITTEGALTELAAEAINRLIEQSKELKHAEGIYIIKEVPVMHDEWLQQFVDKGFIPDSLIILVRRGNGPQPVAHVDGYDTSPYNPVLALNWVHHCDATNYMKWYDYKDPNNKQEVVYTDLNSVNDGEPPKARNYLVSTLNEVDSYMLPKETVTFVKTDIPHDIHIESPDALRVAMSMRFTNQFPSWEEAVEELKEFIL